MSVDERYARQILFAGLGAEGQERLRGSAALLVGCGALGTHVADLLVRSGIGLLRIVDRDFVELSNLHRQTLFDESDVSGGLPKAVAAERHLRAVNPGVRVEAVSGQLDAGNIGKLAEGAQIILDGTDNFDTRLVINDYAVRSRTPWIYAACVGAYGLTMNILPGETPCLRCLLRSTPAPGTVETCDTAGILAPVASLVAALESAEAIKLLSGASAAASRELVAFDLWSNSVQRLRLLREEMSSGCPACDRGEFEFLERRRGARATTLCGRNAVQVHPGDGLTADLAALERRLRPLGPVLRNPFLVRADVDGLQLVVFADGRAIVTGTSDEARARSIYDRYVGA
jgi:molybdopterin/thiamine biosynthesis adenylyltransferase